MFDSDTDNPSGFPQVEFAFRFLPSGSIQPKGRWKKSLEVIAEGWLKRIIGARRPEFYSNFWERPAFDTLPGDVHSEWSGYTADAIIRLGNLLPDSYIAKEKQIWLEKILAAQDPDGYMGCCKPKHRWKGGFEIWSQDRLLQALLSEYECTGDERIIDACLRAARCMVRNLAKEAWQGVYSRHHTLSGPYQAGHSLNVVHPLLQLYEISGDESLKELALEIYEDFDSTGSDISARSFLTADLIMTHIVTVCENLSIPAKIYAFTGDTQYLEASLRCFDLLKNHSGQVTGIVSGNEFTYGIGPRKYTEHCGVVEWAISNCRLTELTGQVKFADAAERAMLNAYFASKSPDGVTLCYNHAPNQVVATNWSGPYEDNWDQGMFRNHYSMKHEPRCCNANTSRGFPNFVERAVMGSADGGVAFVFYGPCAMETWSPIAGRLFCEMDTDYPFEDEVRIEVTPEEESEFPIYLRIPEWCRSAEIEINDSRVDLPANPGTFVKINRTWKPGDKIRIRFDVPITLHMYDRSWVSVPGVAIIRGPLTYTLDIPEEWVYVGEGKPGKANLDEEWNVIPQEGAVWNVALELNLANPEESLKLVKLAVPKNSLPWEHPPIALEAKARVLPDWTTDTINGKPQTPSLPQPPLQPKGKAITVRLVPFGFKHIHMTYLPVVGVENNQAILENFGKAKV